VVLIGLAVLAATLLSGLYPAWRAGRVQPVDSIKLV
jgi:ABC-type lipoprotein release transport system permease subunit